jgi:hypothetical protein
VLALANREKLKKRRKIATDIKPKLRFIFMGNEDRCEQGHLKNARLMALGLRPDHQFSCW